MRFIPILAGSAILAGAGCTPFPDVEDSLTQPGAYPRLQRIEALTATAPAEPRLTGSEAETLQGLGETLRGEGAAVSGAGPDPETLERLQKAREAYDDAAAGGASDGDGADGETGRTRVAVSDAGLVLDTGSGGDAGTLARVERLRSGGGESSGAGALLERADEASQVGDDGLTDEERRLLLLRARDAGAAGGGNDDGDAATASD